MGPLLGSCVRIQLDDASNGATRLTIESVLKVSCVVCGEFRLSGETVIFFDLRHLVKKVLIFIKKIYKIVVTGRIYW